MIDGIYLSTAGGLVQEAKHSVVANNVANVNTPGFKKQYMVFENRLAEALNRDKSLPATLAITAGGGAWIAKTVTDFSQGALNKTDNPLDLAIQGEGFFAVTDGKNRFYTRAGGFTLDGAGNLMTADGKYHVLDENGRPVTIQGDHINIKADGTIYVMNQGQETAEGKIGLFTFQEMKDNSPDLSTVLVQSGDGNFRYYGNQALQATGAVRQGYLEQSTANVVEEMAAMIAGFRAFEANMQAVRAQDAALGSAVSQVGRVMA